MTGKFNIILLTTIFIVVFWNFLLPGIRVANDLPFLSKELLDSSLELPQTWSEKGAEGLGEYVSFFLWSWPLSFVSGLLSNLSLPFSLIERMLIFFSILLGSWGIWNLAKKFNIGDFGRLTAALFYLINTYIILLIDGGQLSVALAYSFLPISFYALDNSINKNYVKKIIAGLAVAILGFLDIRFIYTLAWFCLLWFLYQLIRKSQSKLIWVSEWVKTAIIAFLILIGLNSFWLLPLTQAPISSNTFSFFTQTAFIPFGNIGHPILMLAPHWFKNVYGQISPLRLEFIFIPIFVFLAPILRPKNRTVGFWILVAAISIFLTKGFAEPLPDVYQWLFSDMPGFSLFRDSSKFFVLLALAYSMLLGVTFDEIIKRLRNSWIKHITFVSLICYLLFLIRPIFGGQMTGLFSKPAFEGEYSHLTQIVKEDKVFSRIFWNPYRTPLGFSSPNHPVEEASRLVQKRPFNIGTKGTYETFNFLREAPFMGEIFDVAGIGYVVYPPLDPRRDDMHPDNIRYYQIFSNQLSNLSWLTRVDESPINLWEVKNHQNKFFITENLWWVIGSDEIYNEATKSAELKLSKNALIFPEESAGLGNRLDELPDVKIVLNKKKLTDLAASFIDSSKLIFPAKQLKVDPDQSGWWKRGSADLIRWRDFLQTKYGIDNLDFDLGGGWAVGEGIKKLKIKNEELKINRILLARVMESTKSGELKFYQDNQLIGNLTTKNEGNNIRWFEVGALTTDGSLTIHSEGEINVVNALAVLGRDEWAIYQDKAKKLAGQIVNFDKKNIVQDNNPSVTYQKINSTKYKVNISNLERPAMIVFSQTYDPHWVMNGQKSLPSYSFLNGFRVEKDGEYIIEFEVQNWVYPGLIISGATLFLIALIIFKNVRSKST